MHILIISQYFWPENFRINDLAVGLKERGHDITVLTGVPNYPSGRFFPGYGIFKRHMETYKGVKVLRFPLIPRGKGRAWNLAMNYMSATVISCLLAPFYCRDKYDLIFVPQLSPVTVGLPAIVMKKLRSLPILFWILDLWPESLSATGALNSSRALAIVRYMVRYIYSQCDRILISSRGFRQSIETTGGYTGVIDYFPNWIEPEYAVSEGGEQKTVLPDLPEGFRIMFAGNIGVAQDFETVLLAAERLREYQDVHWLILGDGRNAEWLRGQVEARGLDKQFHLLGRYAAEAMPAFFAQADAMLVTLKRQPSLALTVPGKIQSYMACGKPIIAGLDGEGARLVAESGAGLTAPSGDVDALAAAVLAIYQMPKEQREEMGQCGRVYCEANFERNKLIERLEKWMLDLVGARG